MQTYDRGVIYNITSGTLSGRLLAVKEPVYDVYVTNGLQGGLLGLPATGELIEPNGMREQMFEGGAIEYDPATLVATLLSPVGSVAIQPSTSAQLNLGGTLTVTATVTSNLGILLSNRAVIWNTTNGNVAQIASASGLTATIKGVGGGVRIGHGDVRRENQLASFRHRFVALLPDWRGRANGIAKCFSIGRSARQIEHRSAGRIACAARRQWVCAAVAEHRRDAGDVSDRRARWIEHGLRGDGRDSGGVHESRRARGIAGISRRRTRPPEGGSFFSRARWRARRCNW